MENISKDIRFLTETLEHRQSATEQEEQAADYVLERLTPYVEDARKMTFSVVENFRLVLGAYYGEFVVTCALAFWWPTVAFFYGFFVFLAYLAEIFGYPVFSRLLAYYESSSVSGYTEGDDPERLLVFTAYLDTDDSPVSDASGLPIIRYLNGAILVGMVLVLATCATDAYGAYFGAVNPFTWWIRWGGMLFFSAAAATQFIISFGSDASQGANHNASGVAALLEIAARVHEQRIGGASVLLYFSGGHFANMAGMRELVHEISGMHKEAYIINLEGVGAGQLCYTEAEGILLKAACSKRMVRAAETCAGPYEARSARVHDFATNAYLPLIRGLNAISVVGLDEKNLPVNYGADEDIRMHLDPESVLKAARFAEAVGRTVIGACENRGKPQT